MNKIAVVFIAGAIAGCVAPHIVSETENTMVVRGIPSKEVDLIAENWCNKTHPGKSPEMVQYIPEKNRHHVIWRCR
jgi:hypothetical protein